MEGGSPPFLLSGGVIATLLIVQKEADPHFTQDLCFHCPSLMHVLSHATIVITLNKIGYYQNESWSWELENNGDQ